MTPTTRGAQYASDETTSPPSREPSDIQFNWLIEFLTNRTEPSANSTFTPPGCRLLGLNRCPKSTPQPSPQSSRQPENADSWFGVRMMLVRVRPGEPVPQRKPRFELGPGLATMAFTQAV